MNPAITILAADTELAEPVAAGWQLVVAALAGIAADRRADHGRQIASVPRADLRRLTVGLVAQGPKSIGVVLESFATVSAPPLRGWAS